MNPWLVLLRTLNQGASVRGHSRAVCLGIDGVSSGFGRLCASWKKEQVSSHLCHTCDSYLPAAGHS